MKEDRPVCAWEWREQSKEWLGKGAEGTPGSLHLCSIPIVLMSSQVSTYQIALFEFTPFIVFQLDLKEAVNKSLSRLDLHICGNFSK